MRKLPQIKIGTVFDFWTVLGREEPVGHGKCRKWLCKCRCGVVRLVSGPCLKEGRSKSCGCKHYRTSRRINADPNETAFLQLYNNYRSKAKRHKQVFELTENIFRERTQMSCFYCGATPEQKIYNGNKVGVYIYNGLDRADSSKGYTEQNSVPCCGRCNEMKMSDSSVDFLKRVKKIAENCKGELALIN